MLLHCCVCAAHSDTPEGRAVLRSSRPYTRSERSRRSFSPSKATRTWQGYRRLREGAHWLHQRQEEAAAERHSQCERVSWRHQRCQRHSATTAAAAASRTTTSAVVGTDVASSQQAHVAASPSILSVNQLTQLQQTLSQQDMTQSLNVALSELQSVLPAMTPAMSAAAGGLEACSTRRHQISVPKPHSRTCARQAAATDGAHSCNYG